MRASGLVVASLAVAACQATPGAPDAAVRTEPSDAGDARTDVRTDATDADALADVVEAPPVPPCFIGGSSTLAPANVACFQSATGRIALGDEFVYWTVQRPGDVVVRAPRAGGWPERVATATAGAVGLVLVGERAYYTLPSLNLVMSVPVAGGLSHVVTSGVAFPILVASDGASLYLTGGEDGHGTISKVPLAGGVPQTLADGLAHPRGIGVEGGDVYWVDFVDGALLRTSAQGDASAPDGGVRTIVRLATGLLEPSDLLLNGGFGYLADRAGRIVRVPLDVGGIQVVAPAQGIPYGVATDGVSLFWTTLGDGGGVFKAPLAGGDGKALVAGEADPHFIVAGPDAVFWGSWGAGGTIKRAATF